MPQSKVVKFTVPNGQRTTIQDSGLNETQEGNLNSKPQNRSNEISELEMHAILTPNLEENNSFQLLQTMRADSYSPNKDDWSYDSENYLTTYLADNPLSPSSDTKFVCDQQACLIESVLSSVDFSKTELGVSEEWDDFYSALLQDEGFRDFFYAGNNIRIVSPISDSQQLRQILFLRK